MPTRKILFLFAARFFAIRPTMADTKKRVIKSLETLSEDLKELLKKQYPNGFEASITRIINAKKEHIFVFPLETDDAIYLIKVPATKNSEGEYDVDFGKEPEAEGPTPGESDEFSNEGSGDDFDNSDEDYDEEGGGRGKDPSYEPDFDN